jgi:hypothetical protein
MKKTRGQKSRATVPLSLRTSKDPLKIKKKIRKELAGAIFPKLGLSIDICVSLF